MKLRHIAFLCLVSIALPITADSNFPADRAMLNRQEKREAQRAAQQFVRKLQETRDVAPLIDELFLSDFITHFVSNDESVSPSLYARLTPEERRRLFIAQSNAGYLMTLDVLCKPERKLSQKERSRSAFESIFPSELAAKLRNTIWRDGEFQFSSDEDFRARLPEIETVLSEARAYLVSRGIEQTPECQRKLDDTVKGTGVNYRVRSYIGGDEIKDSEPLAGFPANQKFFRVETPLLMGVILVKEGNQMKIVRLTVVDGD